ncbi:response regulator transcription factor [Hazenella coriacea]|uniref:DNA-binding NarL/FixJ family response regulator n=1 Tax=Hazenella coriacea TaxID=1179467 RepID=A0A4R3L108_9BACL|nr:response regulator transcription factor [Hazenella coriacea]TCS92382.1 DNA-binding NarL/FixJ family response regulator [Hazenella coriacea]
MKQFTRVLIWEKNKAFLFRTQQVLREDPEIEMVGSVSQPLLLKQLMYLDIDVDVILIGCLDLVYEQMLHCMSKKPFPDVVLLADQLSEEYFSCIKYGISALLLKDNIQELPQAIRVVQNQGLYLCKDSKDKFWHKNRVRHQMPKEIPLTDMEKKVVQEIIKDKSNQEIAETLYISRRTVEYHITSAIQKLKVKSRVGLAVKALGLYGQDYWLSTHSS